MASGTIRHAVHIKFFILLYVAVHMFRDIVATDNHVTKGHAPMVHCCH